MLPINWTDFTPALFQQFCNCLLSLEISKSFIPYTAEGKDGGIDGQFNGDYNGKTGKWRFQYKFHRGHRNSVINLLVAEVRNEFAKKPSEDHFVLITNVELLPADKNKLLAAAIGGATSIDFEVWDEAKLQTIYFKFPILKLWLTEGFSSSQLIDYKEYFGDRLTSSISEISTLNNPFAARDTDLKELKDFKNSSELIAVISGEAGIGKTRIVIEIARREFDNDDDWMVLALTTANIELDKIASALSAPKNFLIIVDDAHDFGSNTLGALKRFPENRGKIVKIILTVRKYQVAETLTLLNAYDHLKTRHIQLKPLTRTETRDILLANLSTSHFYKSHVDELTVLTNGQPILILAIVRAALQGISIATIKTDNFLQKYVSDYLEGFVITMVGNTAESKVRITNLIRLICLLEPLNFKSDEFLVAASKSEDLGQESIRHIITELIRNNLLVGRREYSIKPDFYSDIFLARAEKSWISSRLLNFKLLISNIIVNISAIEESTRGSLQITNEVDKIVEDYLLDLNIHDVLKTIELLQTIESITILKPQIARRAITQLIDQVRARLKNNSADAIDNSNLYKEVVDIGKQIIFDLLYFEDHYAFGFSSVIELSLLFPSIPMVQGTFSYSRRDYTENYQLQRQKYFVENAEKAMSNVSQDYLKCIIPAFQELLHLEFRHTAADLIERGKIHINTYYLPPRENVKGLRTKIIKLLILAYQKTISESDRKTVYNCLLDIPRSIAATRRTPSPYSNSIEINLVLEFLATIIPTLSFKERGELIDKLYWIEKWGIDLDHSEKLKDLRIRLSPSSLPDRINQLFVESELQLGEETTENVEQNVIEHSREMIEESTSKDLANALIQIAVNASYLPHYYWTFTSTLCRIDQTKAKEIYNQIFEHDKNLAFQIGSTFLRILRYEFGEEDFYRDKIDDLYKLNSIEADALILHSISHLNDRRITETDYDILKNLSFRENTNSSYNYGTSLISALRFNPSDSLSLIIDFLRKGNSRAIGHFLLLLTDKKYEQFKPIKRAFLENTIYLDFTHDIARCLELILETEDGFEEVFNYLLARLEYKTKLIKDHNWSVRYEVVPNQRGSHLTRNLTTDQQTNLYFKTVDWYLSASDDSLVMMYQRAIVEYLQPLNQINAEFYALFLKRIEKETNLSKVLRIASCISEFEVKNHLIIDLALAINSSQVKREQHRDSDKLTSASFEIITSVGAKSGAVGEPFPVDVDLRNLVESALMQHSDSNESQEFLSKVKGYLDHLIEDSKREDDELW